MNTLLEQMLLQISMAEHGRIDVLLRERLNARVPCQGPIFHYVVIQKPRILSSYALFSSGPLSLSVLCVQPPERKVRAEKAHLLNPLGQMRHTFVH